MKWVTRARIKTDRLACAWLVRRFIDAQAVFLFVAAEQVLPVAEQEGGTPFGVAGAELAARDGRSAFEAFLVKYGLDDPGLRLMGRIVYASDATGGVVEPEGAGLSAIAEGFRWLGLRDDHEILAKEMIVYDALHAYCRRRVEEGQPAGG
jgi:hypothetical protein